MGLKLGVLINPSIELNHFDLLKFKTLVIDGYDFLYNALTRIKRQDKILYNDKGEPISHYLYLLDFIINLLERKVRPIFIFDNINALNYNIRVKDKIEKIVEILNKQKSKDKTQKMNTNNMLNNRSINENYVNFIDNISTLIKFLGINTVISPTNIFQACKKLISEKKAAGIITNDYNCLLFGIHEMYRKLNFENDTLQRILLQNVLNSNKINFDQFLAINLIMGNDYFSNKNSKSYGVKTSLKLIKEFGTLENLIKHGIINEHDFQEFKNFFITPDSLTLSPEPSNLNRFKAKEYLLKIGLSQESFEQNLDRLAKAYRNLTFKQTFIDQFL